jgi:hypothetical protein
MAPLGIVDDEHPLGKISTEQVQVQENLDTEVRSKKFPKVHMSFAVLRGFTY